MIDSGVEIRSFLYEKSDSACVVEIQILEEDNLGNWIVHDDSIATFAMGTNYGRIEEVNVAIATSNLTLDIDG